jgi:hypothetical protein
MRRVLVAFLAISLLHVPLASGQPSDRPPKLEPLPEPPPPPPAAGGVEEPRVQIPVQEGDKVEEVRAGGRVIAIQVTPPGGKPYFLVDTSGTGTWVRRESLDDGVRFPMWPIYTFD